MSWPESITRILPVHARESGIVFVGDVVAKSLTFLITVLLFRLLQPEQYVLYGVFITALATVQQFTDSGLHSSIIRFTALYAADDPDRAAAHVRFGWRVKWLALAGSGAAITLAARPLADWVFFTPALAHPLRILGVGLLGFGAFDYMLAVLQARQNFKPLTAFRIVEGFGKAAVIAGGAVLGWFSLDLVYYAYMLTPGVLFLLALLLMPSLRSSVPFDWHNIGTEIFSFGKWMMLTSFATMFLMRLDVFMVTPLLSDRPAEVGHYAAAVRLCMPLIVLTGSIATVFFPKAMAVRSMIEMRSYVRRSLQVTVPVSLLSIAYAVLVAFLVPEFFPKYGPSVPMFGVLVLGYVWTILGNPLTMLVLSINRANIVTMISAVQLLITLVSHYFFILALGAIGAAISTVLLWFAAGSFSMWYLYSHRHEIETRSRVVQP